ncbi:nicotinic acid mononucleotide adenyltransferase [Aquimarina brevivitae]|uniref:Nicotinic acid mononucleotide adenyltransferase n=1 Tax=Aquimarina brevivitae TaxID=323412 RepID=A0A4Q7PFI4_9FLAO|nr:nicotinic acid mononucleotide adenyltransferase [Aquimarina brevivitae]RZS99236.1 hypothetical protein EV197_0445 [Aquimarina brevivitae]
MKTLKLFSVILFGAIVMSSCVADVVIQDEIVVDEPRVTLNQLLATYEIWYLDIHRTIGNGAIPFMDKAFTLSFRNGTFFANNNLVGMGANGNGFGLDVGFYDTFAMELDISHDLDGFYRFEVFQAGPNEIRLYHRSTNTTYFLEGYQRNTFDYDLVFYENIHYFLQEYEAWEKVYTSNYGAINEFDNENYLQFLYYGSGDNFRSSQDPNGTPINTIYYDYTGYYEVNDIPNDFYSKTLTLDYDYLGNEFFELTVINDGKIELFHPSSGTVYRFVGRGYLQFKNSNGEQQNQTKRIRKSDFLKHKKV